MPAPLPVSAPAGFAPLAAIGFTQADATLAPVSTATPLPVALQPLPPLPPVPPLEGTASGAAAAGPFAPEIGRPVILTLSGRWTGTVWLLRSADGGTTRTPLTVGGLPWASFTANCCEPVWEEGSSGAELYLDIALSSGTLAYRIEQ